MRGSMVHDDAGSLMGGFVAVVPHRVGSILPHGYGGVTCSRYERNTHQRAASPSSRLTTPDCHIHRFSFWGPEHVWFWSHDHSRLMFVRLESAVVTAKDGDVHRQVGSTPIRYLRLGREEALGGVPVAEQAHHDRDAVGAPERRERTTWPRSCPMVCARPRTAAQRLARRPSPHTGGGSTPIPRPSRAQFRPDRQRRLSFT